jgi:hypothetical protein
VFTVKLSKLLVLALILVSATRTIPALVNSAVFSTDSWPLIRLTRLLAAEPQIRVFSIEDRHAKWPIAVLSSLVYTEVTGLDVYFFYAYIGAPILVLTLSILLYLLLGRLADSASRTSGLLALLVYSPFVVFTSAYLKEVYAYPIALLVLYLALVLTRKSRWLAVLLGATTLVLTHPLTALITLVFTPTYVFVKLTDRVKYCDSSTAINYGGAVLLTALLSVLYAVHGVFIGTYYVFSLVDLVVLGAYSIVFYGAYFALYADKRGLVAFTAFSLLVLTVIYSLLVEGVEVGLNTVLHGVPLLLLVTSLGNLRSEESHVSASLLLPVAVGSSYTLTYAKWLATITHRFLNYMVFPVATSIVVFSRIKPRLSGLVLVLLVFNSIIVLYNVYTGRDPATFYWRYTVADTTLGDFIYEYAAKRLVSGVKYNYQLGDLVATTSPDLLEALRNCSASRGVVLAISYEELVYGVPVSPLYYVKPTVNITHCSSVVYSSALNYLLVK